MRYSGILTVLFFFLAAVLSGGAEKGSGAALRIVSGGRPKATIVLSKTPTRAAQLGAYELQWHIKQITGVEIPIGNTPEEGMVAIYIGDATAAESAGLTDWKEQEYALRFTDNSIILAGQDKDDRGKVTYDLNDPFAFNTWPGLFDAQGTLHAVYHFLQKYCNVRWYSPVEAGTVLPKQDTLTVQGHNVKRRPAFLYRDIGHIGNMAEGYDAGTQLWPDGTPEFKSYIEAAYPDMYARWGTNRWKWIHGKRGWTRLWLMRNGMGGSEKFSVNHSLYNYYERFLQKDHANFEAYRPELFAKGYEGKPPQLCYSSPETVAQVVADARDYFDHGGYAKPMSGIASKGYQWGENYFAVEPMDNASFCRCERCTSQYEPDSPRHSQHSRYWFTFINKVARELKKSHPDKYIATLAYMTHLGIPKATKLEDNVAIQLCLHIRNVYSKDLQESDMESLYAWTQREKGHRIGLWLYYTFPLEFGHRAKFHVFPGYFAHTIGKRFKEYYNAGVRGMYFCGFAQEVDAYVTFRMLDDPSERVEDILDEFFSRYYGASAVPMKNLYLMVEDIYCNPDNYKTFGHQSKKMALEWLYNSERMDAMQRLMDDAIALAKTEVEKQRLKLFELSTWSYMQAAVHKKTLIERKLPWDKYPAFLHQVVGTPVLKENALRGRVFVYDTKGSLAQGGTIGVLTDGKTGNIFTYHKGNEPILMRCTLGPVHEKGRQLREVRIIWSIGDPARSRAVFQIDVHKEKGDIWETVTQEFISDVREGLAGSYREFVIPFPPGGVTGFDAIRISDLSQARGFYTPRIIEIEADIETEKR